MSNRIHRDDLAGLIATLPRSWQKSHVPKVINAADDEPAAIGAVEEWLAEEMNAWLVTGESGKSVREIDRCPIKRFERWVFCCAIKLACGIPPTIDAWRTSRQC